MSNKKERLKYDTDKLIKILTEKNNDHIDIISILMENYGQQKELAEKRINKIKRGEYLKLKNLHKKYDLDLQKIIEVYNINLNKILKDFKKKEDNFTDYIERYKLLADKINDNIEIKLSKKISDVQKKNKYLDDKIYIIEEERQKYNKKLYITNILSYLFLLVIVLYYKNH